MARRRLTCCRNYVNYRSDCAIEFPMTGNVHCFEFHRSQRLDDGTNLQRGVHQGVCQALVAQQQAVHQARHQAPNQGDGGEDPEGDDSDDDEDANGPGGPGGPGGPRENGDQFEAQDGWIMTICTHDGGECFFHT